MARSAAILAGHGGLEVVEWARLSHCDFGSVSPRTVECLAVSSVLAVRVNLLALVIPTDCPNCGATDCPNRLSRIIWEIGYRFCINLCLHARRHHIDVAKLYYRRCSSKKCDGPMQASVMDPGGGGVGIACNPLFEKWDQKWNQRFQPPRNWESFLRKTSLCCGNRVLARRDVFA